jgi:hypothetical protein
MRERTKQTFASLALAPYLWVMKLGSLAELAGMTLQVGYSRPGEFGVGIPHAPWKRPPALLLIRERSAAAALQAARRIDPRIDGAEIVPAALAVTVAYQWGEPPASGGIIVARATPTGFLDRYHRFP